MKLLSLSSAALFLASSTLGLAAALLEQAELSPSLGEGSGLQVQLSPVTLNECDITTVSWTGGLQGVNVSASIFVNIDHDGTSFSNSWTTDDAAEQTSWDWQVAYPAGSTVEFSVYMSRPEAPEIGQKNAFVSGSTSKVKIGLGDNKCIPAANYPVVIDADSLQNLTACERHTISWSGGAAPYTISAHWDPENNHGYTNFRRSYELGQTNATSFGWPLDFPSRSVVGFSVRSANGPSERHAYNAGLSGPIELEDSILGDHCVPEWHHRAGRFPVWAIVLISVAGGILGLVIISIAAIVLVRKVRDSKKQPIEI